MMMILGPAKMGEAKNSEMAARQKWKKNFMIQGEKNEQQKGKPGKRRPV